MLAKRFIPKPDFSRDYESPDDAPEDPSLSGGLIATESDEHLERHSTDSECEPEQEEDEEGEEEEEAEGEPAPDDVNDDSSEISSEDFEAFVTAKSHGHGDGGTPRDVSSSSRSSPGTSSTRERKSWATCLQLSKVDRPKDAVLRELRAFLERDLKNADYEVRRDQVAGKTYWGGWCEKDVSGPLFIFLLFHSKECNSYSSIFHRHTIRSKALASLQSSTALCDTDAIVSTNSKLPKRRPIIMCNVLVFIARQVTPTIIPSFSKFLNSKLSDLLCARRPWFRVQLSVATSTTSVLRNE